MIVRAAATPGRLYYLIKIIAVSPPLLMLALSAVLDDYSQTQINSFDFRAQNCISGIQMVSDQEGWAGPCSDNYHGILHYQHGRSTWEDTPDIAIFSMNGQNGWGVQDDGTGFGRRLFHYQHSQWIAVRTDLGDKIAAIDAMAPNAVWALTVGGHIWHYDGQVWRQEPIPVFEQYNAEIDMVSPTEGWAWDTKTLLHYTQNQWLDFPRPDKVNITRVTSFNNDVWLLGFRSSPYHFNVANEQWEPVIPLRDGTPVLQLTYDSLSLSDGSDGWLTGYTSHYLPNDEQIIDQYFSWQLTKGQFMAVKPPKQVDRIVFTDLGEGWGVGFDGMPSQDPPRFLVHYDHGSWYMTLIPRLPLPFWIVITRIGLALLLASFVYFSCWLLTQAIIDPHLSSRRWPIVMGCLCALVTALLLIITMMEPFIFIKFQPQVIINLRVGVTVLTIVACIPLLGTLFARKSLSEPST